VAKGASLGPQCELRIAPKVSNLRGSVHVPVSRRLLSSCFVSVLWVSYPRTQNAASRLLRKRRWCTMSLPSPEHEELARGLPSAVSAILFVILWSLYLSFVDWSRRVCGEIFCSESERQGAGALVKALSVIRSSARMPEQALVCNGPARRAGRMSLWLTGLLHPSLDNTPLQHNR